MPDVNYPSTTSSPADIFHITLPDDDDLAASYSSDEGRAITDFHSRLAQAGSVRVQELFEAAAQDVRQRLATLPKDDQATRKATFDRFMQNMRHIAAMQAEDVEARVQMEKRERSEVRGLFAGNAGGAIAHSVSTSAVGSGSSSGNGWGGDARAGPSGSGSSSSHLSAGGSISATTSMSEATLLEQRRLWEEAQVSKALQISENTGTSCCVSSRLVSPLTSAINLQ